MNQCAFTRLGGLLAVVALGWAQPATAQPVLSGLVNFSTNATGANSGFEIWNTLGGDSIFNLYVTQPNSGINGPFLNSGNAAGAGINLLLASGTHSFFLFGAPGSDLGNFGLNLFFNGNNTNPGISVFAATDQPPSPPFPSFAANSSAATRALDTSVVAGAGTLSFASGGFAVTLTDYRWSVPSVENLDRVQGFDNIPGAGSDFVGSFTLQVTAVPEPATFALAGVGLFGAAAFVKRRRAKRKQKQKSK